MTTSDSHTGDVTTPPEKISNGEYWGSCITISVYTRQSQEDVTIKQMMKAAHDIADLELVELVGVEISQVQDDPHDLLVEEELETSN